jgi:hypothetical protein
VRPRSACQCAASPCSLPTGSCQEERLVSTLQRPKHYLPTAHPAPPLLPLHGRSLLRLASAGAAAEPAVDADGAADFTVSRRIVLDDIDWNVVSQVRCACCALNCSDGRVGGVSVGVCTQRRRFRHRHHHKPQPLGPAAAAGRGQPLQCAVPGEVVQPAVAVDGGPGGVGVRRRQAPAALPLPQVWGCGWGLWQGVGVVAGAAWEAAAGLLVMTHTR